MDDLEDMDLPVVALPIGARASRVTTGKEIILAFEQDARWHLFDGAPQAHAYWWYWKRDALEGEHTPADGEADDLIVLLNRLLPPDRWAGEHPLTPGIWGIWSAEVTPGPSSRRWLRDKT